MLLIIIVLQNYVLKGCVSLLQTLLEVIALLVQIVHLTYVFKINANQHALIKEPQLTKMTALAYQMHNVLQEDVVQDNVFLNQILWVVIALLIMIVNLESVNKICANHHVII